VLGTTWDRTGSFLADLRLGVFVGTARVHVLRLWGLSDDALERSRLNEFAFALVPFGEDLVGRCAAQNAWVDQACETDAWDVAGRAEDAFKVPDGFGAASKSAVVGAWGLHGEVTYASG